MTCSCEKWRENGLATAEMKIFLKYFARNIHHDYDMFSSLKPNENILGTTSKLSLSRGPTWTHATSIHAVIYLDDVCAVLAVVSLHNSCFILAVVCFMMSDLKTEWGCVGTAVFARASSGTMGSPYATTSSTSWPEWHATSRPAPTTNAPQPPAAVPTSCSAHANRPTSRWTTSLCLWV